ncbi:MAG: DNA recombination protein RmuC [Planctomycetes bacterium]|nr:DNA recombination protein RmuC [Planctomycetota bacterium]
MEVATLILIIVAILLLVILLVMTILQLRNRHGAQQDVMREELNGLGDAFTEALGQAGEKFSDAQTRLSTQLTKEIQKVREESATVIAMGDANALERLTKTLNEGRDAQDKRLDKVDETLRQFDANQAKVSNELKDRVAGELTKIGEAQAKSSEALRTEVQKQLDQVRADNTTQLERMRATVDEKLQSTLDKRLGDSFKLVSERLEQVHKGLGEMQQLAAGVGDLKRVLTNVKSRGTFGEVQLAALLEQVLISGQYHTNVATVPNSSERVEFAIRLPGRDGSGTEVLLPIDAKFPTEDYQRLQDAFEKADHEAVAAAQSALHSRLETEAQSIHNKYVAPPHTTDFAVLFLPTEGLYAEALRLPGCVEKLQTKYHVVVAGPTTLYAILNSLQMGFRTLVIEQRSAEIWRVLGAVKTEFVQFGKSLGDVTKKAQELQNKLEQVGVRQRAMGRKLKGVDALPEQEALSLLGSAEGSTTQDEEPEDQGTDKPNSP